MKKTYTFILFIFVALALVGCTKDSSVKKAATSEQEDVTSENSNSLLSPNRIVNIAHRGASGYAPENTLASYKTGEKMVGDYIEIDLQMTKDGELIAMHDAGVARTTNSKGLVKNLTINEIKDLDAGSWFNKENPDLAKPVFNNLKIPTLDEIIATFGKDSNYYIETKNPEEYPDMAKELVSTLEENGLLGSDVPRGRVIIQSFSTDSLHVIHKLDPSIPLIQLISYQDIPIITTDKLDALKKYAVGIGVNCEQLTEEYVKKVREAGLLLHPYTVNEEKDMKRLIEWGVTGMFTNYPDRLNEVLDEIDREKEK